MAAGSFVLLSAANTMEQLLVRSELRETLRRQGFIVIRSAIQTQLLDTARSRVLETLQKFGDKLAQPEGELPYCLPLPLREHYPLIDRAEELLKEIGADPHYLQNLMLIMKRPHEGRRYWHTDMGALYAPSHEDAPEVFVLYFLQKTTLDLKNGCLLVVPGYAEGPQHSDRVTTPMKDEYAIEVELGDVIVFDPRLLHGSMPNDSEDYRYNIRLWIQTRWTKEEEC